MDVSKLNQFPMPYANTCSLTGEVIEIGDPIFAETMDQVLSGGGICLTAYKELIDVADELEEKTKELELEGDKPEGKLAGLVTRLTGSGSVDDQDVPAAPGSPTALAEDKAIADAASEGEGAE